MTAVQEYGQRQQCRLETVCDFQTSCDALMAL
jgi:hypothetical protein